MKSDDDIMNEQMLKLQFETFLNRLEHLENQVQEVHDTLLSRPVCPQPGKCVELTTITTDHEHRIRVLERVHWRSAGVASALAAIGASGLTVGLQVLIKHL